MYLYIDYAEWSKEEILHEKVWQNFWMGVYPWIIIKCLKVLSLCLLIILRKREKSIFCFLQLFALCFRTSALCKATTIAYKGLTMLFLRIFGVCRWLICGFVSQGGARWKIEEKKWDFTMNQKSSFFWTLHLAAGMCWLSVIMTATTWAIS